MPTSRTETAIAGLAAMLTAVSTGKFATPLRNEALLTSTKAFGVPPLKGYSNLWDGAGGPADVDQDQALGADNDLLVDRFELQQRPQFELVFEAGTEAQRGAALEAALIAIDDGMRADRSLGGALGAEGWCGIEGVAREGAGVVTEGIAGAKGAVVTVLLIFTSNRPF